MQRAACEHQSLVGPCPHRKQSPLVKIRGALNPRPRPRPRDVASSSSTTRTFSPLNPSPSCPRLLSATSRRPASQDQGAREREGSPTRMALLFRPTPPSPHLRAPLRCLLSIGAGPFPSRMLPSPRSTAAVPRLLFGPRYVLPLPTTSLAGAGRLMIWCYPPLLL